MFWDKCRQGETVMKPKTAFTGTWIKSWKLHHVMTSYSCWVASMPKLATTSTTVRGYSDAMALEKWTSIFQDYWIYAENELTITNILFRQADKYEATWMHRQSKQCHLTDYAICCRRDIHNVKITKAMHGAECWTGHSLVSLVLTMHIMLLCFKKHKITSSSFKVAKLKNSRSSRPFAEIWITG